MVCFVDAAHFVHGPYLGYLWCFVRLLMRGPSGRKRFNVLGAIDAVTHELTTICNETTIDAQAICELLGKLSARYAGLPLTLVLDNARYQRCEPGPGPWPGRVADRVAVPAAVLAEPEPDRAAVEVREEGGACRAGIYEDFTRFKAAIVECLEVGVQGPMLGFKA